MYLHWIIPALAGNTGKYTVPPSPAKDHPRSRGEYTVCNDERTHYFGSSPLSRGILQPAVAPSSGLGIIPALAGNTMARPWILGPRWDHPRSRGEYLRSMCQCFCRLGSSPLSRGIPSHDFKTVPTSGIIPALAGNTSLARSGTVPSYGSSPLSRGIPASYGTAGGQLGIIPALAGNTPGICVGPCAARDHPRSRGEY